MLLDGNAARHVLPTSLSWTSLSNAHYFLRVLLLAFPVTSTFPLYSREQKYCTVQFSD